MKTLSEYFPNCRNNERGIKYLFIGEEGEIGSINTQKKLKLLCSDCGKEILASAGKIFGGQQPCACGRNYYKTPERKLERLLEVIDRKNYILNSAEDIISSNQNISLYCRVCEIEWHPTYASVVNAERGCPSCAKQYRYSDDEYIQRVSDIGVLNKFKFVGKISEDKLKQHSHVKLRCDICEGEWCCSLGNILSGKYSCPNCARRGFNPIKRSILYLLKVVDVETSDIVAYKYGITNVLNKRLVNMRRVNTGHIIEIAATWGYTDGVVARQHENSIKQKFTSYLNKTLMPDGYTETINPLDVLELFNFQNNQYNTGVQTGVGTSGGPTN